MYKLKKILTPESSVWIYFILQLSSDIILYSGQYYGVSNFLANYLSYIAFLLALTSIFIFSLKRRKGKLVVKILVIITFIFQINSFLFPTTTIYFHNQIKDIYLRYIPLLLMFSIIDNYQQVIQWMDKYIKVYYGLAFILIYLTFTGKVYSEDVDYMTVSYNVLLPISCLGLSSFLNKRILQFIIFLGSAISLFLIGCRGAFLAALIPCFIYIYQYNKRIIIYLVFGAILIMFNFEIILKWVGDILINIGYDSRTITRIALGETFTSSGRDLIRQTTFNYLNSHGYKPYGLFGDRVILQLSGYDPSYIHNIILEIFIDFGFLLGFCLLISIFLCVRKSLKLMNKDGKIFAITLYSCCIVKLMLSNSYLVDQIFYVCAGIVISGYSNHKRFKRIKIKSHEENIDYNV